MPIPLYGFMEGDTLGLVVLAEESDTIQQLAHRLQESASIRVGCKDELHVVHDGKKIDPALTVKQSGLQELDRFDVIWRARP